MKPLYVKKNGVVYRVSGTGIPSIYPAANVEYDNTVTSELQATDVQDAIDELSTRQGGVQSDWDEDDTTELSYIQNKPNLGTAAFKDVPASGDAGFTQVVLGKDTRLTYYDRNRYDASVKCSTNIVEGNIIVGLNGLYHHLNDGTVFDITYPILYAKNNMAAGAANKSNYDSLAIDITITQQITLTQFLPVYIKGRLSGNMFNPISTTPLTQEMSQDGYHYMLLGLAGTTTNMYLFHDHRIFANNGGSFCEIVGNLGTAAYRDISASGNASTYQVVTGGDTRLSDARPASDVSAWAKESTKPTYTASEVGAIADTLKGAANGVAELDAAGKVPSSQLPSFVDDVIEVADYDHLPITGESGKIYVTIDTNKTYRWTGSGYVEISESLALGETSSTAYRGDRGKTAYDHATESGKISSAVTSGLYKVAATAQGHIASLTAVEKSDITGLGIPGSDTNTTYTFVGGTNKITVTPSGGTAQDVAITVSDSTKLPLAGGTMTGASGIQFPTTSGASLPNNWISAGGGYSTGSGKSGLKIIACEQADCVSGLGQDCGGGPYELSIITGASTSGDTRIRFLSHKVATPSTYTKLAEIQSNGNFVCTSINGFTIGKSVPADAVFTDHTYNFGGTTFYSGNSGSAEHNANSIQYNGVYYYTSNGPSTAQGATVADGALYAEAYSTAWVGQIAQDYRNGNLWVRGKNNGTFQYWKGIVTDDILLSLVPTANKFLFNPIDRKIIANKSTSAWDAQVYSKNGYTTNCQVSWKPAQTNMAIMFGLDNNPTQDANYNTIDYCWYMQNSGGGLSIYENGTSIASISGHTTYAAGDDLRIEYANGVVKYYHNGVCCRSVARAVSGKLYVDSSFHGASGAVYDFYFGPTTIDASSVNGLTLSLVT